MSYFHSKGKLFSLICLIVRQTIRPVIDAIACFEQNQSESTRNFVVYNQGQKITKFTSGNRDLPKKSQRCESDCGMLNNELSQHTRGNLLLLTKLLKCPSISIWSSKKEEFPLKVGSRKRFIPRTHYDYHWECHICNNHLNRIIMRVIIV